MDPQAAEGPEYVLGHSRGELKRLALQGRIYENATLDMLEQAGIGPGLRVLDVGCGAGDVSLLAARLVGPTGSVTGVDRVAAAIATARNRAASSGLGNVEFSQEGLEGQDVTRPFDAVIGRFILMHQDDPAELLAQCAARVRPGGSVAFLESHMYGSVPGVHSHPHSEVYDRIVKLKIAVIEAVGAQCDMGYRLPATFQEAGLPRPHLRMSGVVEGHPESDLFRFAAESVRSMLPMIRRHGIAQLTDSDVDALEPDLRAEVTEKRGVLVAPLVVAAWTMLPH